MLSISPVSFCGKLARDSWYALNKNTKKMELVTPTRDGFIDTYDRQIKKIKDAKQFAIQVDDLMFNDPEIQEIIKEMPEDMTIEVAENFCQTGYGEDENDISDIAEPMLMASEEPIAKATGMESSKLHSITSYTIPYREEGPDKEGIINWLKKIQEYFIK